MRAAAAIVVAVLKAVVVTTDNLPKPFPAAGISSGDEIRLVRIFARQTNHTFKTSLASAIPGAGRPNSLAVTRASAVS
jgi:hypothetical protein